MKAKLETLKSYLDAIREIAERANVPFNVQTEESEDDSVSRIIFVWLAEYVNIHIEVGDLLDDESERYHNVTWSHGKGRRSSARYLARTALVDIEQALHPDWKSALRQEGDGYVWHVIDARGERKLQISHRDSDYVIDLNEHSALEFFGVPVADSDHSLLWEVYLESKLAHLVSAVEWRDNPVKEGQRRAVLSVPGQGRIEAYYG